MDSVELRSDERAKAHEGVKVLAVTLSVIIVVMLVSCVIGGFVTYLMMR